MAKMRTAEIVISTPYLFWASNGMKLKFEIRALHLVTNTEDERRQEQSLRVGHDNGDDDDDGTDTSC